MSNQVFRGVNNNLAGESHPNSKLESHDIVLIFNLKAEGLTNRVLADKFDVSPATISYVLNNRSRKYGR